MRGRVAAAVAALALLTTSCAMRASHKEVVDAARGSGSGASRSTATGDSTDAGSASAITDADGAAATGDSGSSGAAGGSGASAVGGDSNAAGGTSGGGSSGGTSAGGSASSGGPKSPVKIASVGTLSGPAGGTLLPSVNGLRGWVRHINDKGGLNGHEVQLTVADDGGDPARHRSQVQDLVEKQKVAAFINNTEALTGQSSVEYLNSKRVPTIGSDTGEQHFNTSPMHFPQASSGDKLLEVAIFGPASQAVAKGMKKSGVLSCTEAQICRDLTNRAPTMVPQAGMDLVYNASASLAQVDFTAECLNARNRGVQLLNMSLDTNSVARVARSCAQQGYRPIFAFGAAIILAAQANDPNFNDHFFGDTNVFPWFQSNTPATAEFQTAVKKYGLAPGVGAATGWVAGKLLEKAAANLPEPPTSTAILRGLWSIKNDTLGGLTAPLTFNENRPASVPTCWYNIAIRGGKWVSTDDFKQACR